MAEPKHVVVATIPVGDVLQGIGVNPQTNLIYTASLGDNRVYVIDGASNTVIYTIPVGAWPRGIAVNPNTNRIYATNYTSDTLSVIDGFSNSVIETLSIDNIGAVALDSNTNRVYLRGGVDNHSISVVDGGTNTVIENIHVGCNARDIVVNQIGNLIYVANGPCGHVSVIDGNTNTVIKTIYVGADPMVLGIDQKLNRIYSTTFWDGSLSIIDGSTNSIIDYVPVGSRPSGSGIAINSDTNLVYVVNNLEGDVYVVDGINNSVVDIFSVGDNPSGGIDVNPLTKRIYVPAGDNKVYVIAQVDQINTLVNFEPNPSTYAFTYDTAGCPDNFVGKFTFDATLTNISEIMLSDLYVEVEELTNNNLLLTNNKLHGEGEAFPITRTDDYEYNLLGPEQHVDVPFTVCLQNMNPFRFYVNVLGLAGSIIHVDNDNCSLIDAIYSANSDMAFGGCSAGNGADTIILSGDVILDDTQIFDAEGPNGLPPITSPITILGYGATISRDSTPGIPCFRIFHIAQEGNLTLKDLTVSNGCTPDMEDARGNDGGGIINFGTLTLSTSMVSGNHTGGGGCQGFSKGCAGFKGGNGGGMANFGTLALTRSTVNNNYTGNGGFGGGLGPGGDGGDGGGIANLDGLLALTNSTVSGNYTGNAGGSMCGYSAGPGKSGDGGGIANIGGENLKVSNSTIVDNYTGECFEDCDGVMICSNGGGMYHLGYGVINLTNSIMSGNTTSGNGPDCFVYMVSFLTTMEYNLIGDVSRCTGIIDGVNGNQAGSSGSPIDAGLGPLQDNGGPTFTHALLPGSPAVDNADNNVCSNTNDPLTSLNGVDQRGFFRPVDGDGNGIAICDIGAFEFGAVP